jgi:hypothetical protein
MAGRLEAALDPLSPLHGFAEALRKLREQAGQPTYRQLAAQTGFAAGTLARAAAGRVLPSWELTFAYVTACGGEHDEWRHRWEAARDMVRQQHGSPVTAPAELPAGLSTFVGRIDETARLDAFLGSNRRQTGLSPLAAIVGMGGIGKTALAIRWAHQNRRQFPDGQVFLDLQGSYPGPALIPSEALARILTSLGVPRAGQPTELADQIALYRSMTSTRRLLLILDDVSGPDQVRPLLPGGHRCATMLTSRGDLRGLMAIEGAAVLALDELEPGDAVALLTGVVGGDRPLAEVEALCEIAARCGYLPLALRIAGTLLAGPSPESIHTFLPRLDRDPLTALVIGGDARAAIRTTLASSLAAVPNVAQGMFTVLGRLPQENITVQSVAAATGQSQASTFRTLERLAAAHLIQRCAHGVYRINHLLYRYAAELAAARDLMAGVTFGESLGRDTVHGGPPMLTKRN